MSKQRKNQDTSLGSGERQVGKALDQIDDLHVWRYKKALDYIGEEDNVLDLGMGIGYGSYILSEKARMVEGVDDSQEAIDYAIKHWKNVNTLYCCGDVFSYLDSFIESNDTIDVIVAFEIIEHVKDWKDLAEKIRQVASKKIIISVPHRDVPVSRSQWHWEHFSGGQIKHYFSDKFWKEEYFQIKKHGKMKDIYVVFERRD